MFKRIVLGCGGITLIFIFLTLVALITTDSNTEKTSSRTAQGDLTTADTPAAEAPLQKKEIVIVDIDELIQQFDANQLAAEDMYEGKRIQVSGELGNVSETFGSYYIRVEGSDQLSFTWVTCVGEREDFLDLQNGQAVEIVGDFQEQSMGSIRLKPCQVIR